MDQPHGGESGGTPQGAVCVLRLQLGEAHGGAELCIRLSPRVEPSSTVTTSSYWVMPYELVVRTPSSGSITLSTLSDLSRLCHGSDHATNKDWEKLPGVQKWDGVPSPYFRLSSGWFQTLKLALGGITRIGKAIVYHAVYMRCSHSRDIDVVVRQHASVTTTRRNR